MVPGYGLYKTYHGESTLPWLRYLIYLSIPLAIGIHTVAAFIIVANPIRHLWYTALMIPRCDLVVKPIGSQLKLGTRSAKPGHSQQQPWAIYIALCDLSVSFGTQSVRENLTQSP